MTKKIESSDELHTGLLKSLANTSQRKKKVGDSFHHDNSENGEGKINLQSSQAIASELNPEVFAAERREKINKLKELIKSGEYNPKSEDIAGALQEDIVFEILTNKSAAND